MTCISEDFLARIISILYQKLTLSAGQIAIASRVLAQEAFEEKAKEGKRSLDEAIRLATHYLGVSAEYSKENDELKISISPKQNVCPLREICPLPFFYSEAINLLSEWKSYPIRSSNNKLVETSSGKCFFQLRLYGD
ncbi:hypothetical protein [Thermofilum adornatum]|uniref:hypothetical protein n=1 Tax=Thermofilum adornatum TaxID=1365176 RepID=UPI00069A5759|nr:hypothetical protein [Thermofilum adornatum]